MLVPAGKLLQMMHDNDFNVDLHIYSAGDKTVTDTSPMAINLFIFYELYSLMAFR
jgi:hypothetical protein